MSGIKPVSLMKVSSSGYSAMSTGRVNSDNSHAYIASRINDLYLQALSYQSGSANLRTRSLRRFVDQDSENGRKLYKVI